jgi:hypothetical protein
MKTVIIPAGDIETGHKLIEAGPQFDDELEIVATVMFGPTRVALLLDNYRWQQYDITQGVKVSIPEWFDLTDAKFKHITTPFMPGYQGLSHEHVEPLWKLAVQAVKDEDSDENITHSDSDLEWRAIGRCVGALEMMFYGEIKSR